MHPQETVTHIPTVLAATEQGFGFCYSVWASQTKAGTAARQTKALTNSPFGPLSVRTWIQKHYQHQVSAL